MGGRVGGIGCKSRARDITVRSDSSQNAQPVYEQPRAVNPGFRCAEKRVAAVLSLARIPVLHICLVVRQKSCSYFEPFLPEAHEGEMEMNRAIAAMACAIAMAFALAGCSSGGAASPSSAQDASSSSVESSTAASAAAGSAASAAPSASTAPSLDPGVYTATFKTDSSMFHVNEAKHGTGELSVSQDGMTIHVALTSKRIVNLYVGTAEQAKADAANVIQPTTDKVTYDDGYEEEVYGFDIPVPAIGEAFDVAILGEKGTWYDHKVTVSDPIPEK